MSTWPETVGKIVDNVSTFSADSLNPIIEALSGRTEYLKNYVEKLTGSTGLIFTDTGFSPKCKLGTVVAWDPGDSGDYKYIPASPGYSDVVRSDGSVAPAYSSYVVGVLITEVNAQGSATVLANGWITDTAVIAAILGSEDPAKGPYYLSESSPGTVTGVIGRKSNIPVYCLTYTGGDKGILIFNPRSPEYSGHSHHSYTLLSTGWVSDANGSTFTSDDPVYINLVNTLTKESAVLTKNGVMCSSGAWDITEDGKIVTTFSVLTDDLMILHAITPLNGLDPLVHSLNVEDGNSLIRLSNSNGNITLATDFDPVSNNQYTGFAVTKLEKSGVVSCPVVHSIFAGPGISLSHSVDGSQNPVTGSFVISSSAVCENQIDMQISNLDGVYFGSDSNAVSYVFPSGRESSLFGNFRVPHYESGEFEAKLTLVVRGSSNAFSLNYEKIDLPATGEGVASLSYTGTTDAVSADNADKYYSITENIGHVTSDMLISCRLRQTSPDTAVKLISASIKLSPRADVQN